MNGGQGQEAEERRSKYSSGLNIINRLDELWRNCHQYKRTGKYSQWNDELDTIFLELARDISPADFAESKDKETGDRIEGYGTKFSKFDEELKKLLPFSDSGNGFDNPEKDRIIKRNKQYLLLMKKQLFLARLENELDKGTSWSEAEDDFD